MWAHEITLTLPLFIEVSLPSQESERSCICVFKGVDFPSVYEFCNWILELFRRLGIFFIFYYSESAFDTLMQTSGVESTLKVGGTGLSYPWYNI